MSQGTPHIEIQQLSRGGATVLQLSGSAGTQDAEKIRDCLDALATAQKPLIILDLAKLEYICSLGLSAMIALHLKSRHYNGSVRLASPKPNVRELLQTTRLDKLFDVYDSVEDAISQES